MENIIGLIEDQHRLSPFSRVRSIRLELGALGPAEPDCLRLCFDAVAQGTVAEGARLDIAIIQAEARCAVCRCITPVQDRFDACQVCGGLDRPIIAGHELRLVELEVV